MKNVFPTIFNFLRFHKNSLKSSLNSIVKKSNIDVDSLSISVKDLASGKSIFQLNQEMLVPPASVLKTITLPAAIDILGPNYEFSTKLYAKEKNACVIKLCGDPYFKQKDLRSLISAIKNKPHTFYIDDTLIEEKDWGEGWQWDNDLNINMPKFNAYNIDDNILSITISANKKNKDIQITNSANYPIPYLNNLSIGNTSKFTISKIKNNFENTLVFAGTIDKSTTVKVPIDSLKHYFEFKMKQCLEEKNIKIETPYKPTIITSKDKEIAQIKHSISEMIDDVLKNSNNLISEIITKTASAKKIHKTGTDIDGANLSKDYCQKIGLDTSKIKIVDASGVSKNNLISANFISEYLVKNQNNPILKHLPTAGEKTLSDRLLPLKNYLYAKTGTLSDISGIAGYLTGKAGHKYAFSIMILDPYSSNAAKKSFEDSFLQELWQKS